MDNKFYVSYEAARLLKEKGYSNFTKSVYRESNPSNTLFFKEEARDWNNMEVSPYTAAPTKAEAIDWLESKGIFILLHMYNIISEDYTIKACWGYRLLRGDEILSYDSSSNTPTRLEAEEAAIIKALELL